MNDGYATSSTAARVSEKVVATCLFRIGGVVDELADEGTNA